MGYKRLSVGLNRLMSTEKFKGIASQTSLDQSGLDQQSYSQHLGRAEFGDLRRNRKTSTSSVQGITSPTGTGGTGFQGGQSRDSSNERPASAMARMGAAPSGGERGGRTGQRSSNFSSQPTSRDSSFGRHDSRVSSNSNLPDLETNNN